MVDKMRKVYCNLEEATSTRDMLSAMAIDVDNFYKDKMSHEDLTRYRYLYFAAAFMNTIPCGFWAFYEMLANKDALEAVKKEVLDIYARKSKLEYEEGDNETEYSAREYFTLMELEEMECMDSLITEALRLRSTSKMLRVRYATDDFKIKLNLPLSKEVHQFDVKKGTYFVSCPTMMHRDPEIFKDPLVFKWDRFLRGPDGRPPVFVKHGRKILRPVDAFGGGATMCPGRRFARAEVKALIATLLVNYDICFPFDEIPEAPIDNKTVVNSGMPRNDVNVNIRKSI